LNDQTQKKDWGKEDSGGAGHGKNFSKLAGLLEVFRVGSGSKRKRRNRGAGKELREAPGAEKKIVVFIGLVYRSR